MTRRGVIGWRTALWAAAIMALSPAMVVQAQEQEQAPKPSAHELSAAPEAGDEMPELIGPPKPETARETDTREAICLMVESAAKASDLPLEFFARVIWQESRFQSDAVGPVTRRGERAQGIAQFLPGPGDGAAAPNPFQPGAALPKTREFPNQPACQFRKPRLGGGGQKGRPRRIREWL